MHACLQYALKIEKRQDVKTIKQEHKVRWCTLALKKGTIESGTSTC